mmetsp:Transcript_7840/g.10199  ORF Transcript_7840/g.10199 Transcript_7840/m.10199 type:complete len:134 (+) Transcript_7840:402-803(+)
MTTKLRRTRQTIGIGEYQKLYVDNEGFLVGLASALSLEINASVRICRVPLRALSAGPVPSPGAAAMPFSTCNAMTAGNKPTKKKTLTAPFNTLMTPKLETLKLVTSAARLIPITPIVLRDSAKGATIGYNING